MKRRLSDDDEIVLHWLGRVASAEKWQDTLQHVRIQGGWAYATDAFRLLAFPVDLPDGYVHRHDAIVGGTVDLLRVLPDECREFPDLSKLPTERRNNEAMLFGPEVKSFRPWYGRRCSWAGNVSPAVKDPKFAKTLTWFRPPALTGSMRGTMVTPDGVHHWVESDLFGAVQSPFLASLLVPLWDWLGVPVRVSGDADRGPLVLSPAPAAGASGPTWRDGWGLLMPLRTFGIQCPHPAPRQPERAEQVS